MLFAGTYKFRPTLDPGAGLRRFQAWSPPSGFSFQGHWARADGAGGMFLAEAESPSAVLEATVAFADLMDFEIVPVVDIMESVGISLKVLSWLSSVE